MNNRRSFLKFIIYIFNQLIVSDDGGDHGDPSDHGDQSDHGDPNDHGDPSDHGDYRDMSVVYDPHDWLLDCSKHQR